MASIEQLAIALFSGPSTFQTTFVLSAVPEGGLDSIENFEIEYRFEYYNNSFGIEIKTVDPDTGVLYSGDGKYHYQDQYELPAGVVGLSIRARMVAGQVNGKNASWKTTDWTGRVDVKVDPNDPVTTLNISVPAPTIDISKYGSNAKLTFDNIDCRTIPSEYRQYLSLTVKLYSNGSLAQTYSKQALTFYESGYGFASLNFGLMSGPTYIVSAVIVYERYTNSVTSTEVVWSSEFGLGPPAPAFISDQCGTKSAHEVYLDWGTIDNANSYDVVWSEKKEYLDLYNMGLATLVSGISESYAIIDVEKGGTYWFKVRAVNDIGQSGWSIPISRSIGAIPGVPTTWSNKTKYMLNGESENDILLNWVHAALDGAREHWAILDISIELNGHIYHFEETLEKQPRSDNPGGTTYIDTASGPMMLTYQGSQVLVNTSVVGVVRKIAGDNPDYSRYFDYNGQEPIYDSVTTFNLTEYIQQLIEDEEIPSLTNGATITWKVKTAGGWIGEYGYPVYGPFSISRQVDVFVPPVVRCVVTYSIENVAPINRVTQYPFYLYLFMENQAITNQVPIYYKIDISSTESYEQQNIDGSITYVAPGDIVYSEVIDNVVNATPSRRFDPGTMLFKNGVRYDISVVVVTNAGCSAVATQNMTMAFNEGETAIQVGMDAYYDEVNAMEYIKPYVFTETSAVPSEYVIPVYLSDYTMFIYRVNKDRTLSLVTPDIQSSDDFNKIPYYPDPFPTMGKMRYRIVAINNTTGLVYFCDSPPLENKETGVIFQWGYNVSPVFSLPDPAVQELSPLVPWAGNMLRLVYNVDISEKASVDVSQVKYIGRSYPVTYYGTAVDEGWSIKAVVDILDTDTLNKVRDLSKYLGDVYFRDDSGAGFWATVNVSFTRNHLDVTSSITIDVTKVSG